MTAKSVKHFYKNSLKIMFNTGTRDKSKMKLSYDGIQVFIVTTNSNRRGIEKGIESKMPFIGFFSH